MADTSPSDWGVVDTLRDSATFADGTTDRGLSYDTQPTNASLDGPRDSRADASPTQDASSDLAGRCSGVTAIGGTPTLVPKEVIHVAGSSWIIDLAFQPNAPSRIWLVEKNTGRVHIYHRDGTRIGEFVDITKAFNGDGLSTTGEQGSLGIALHPHFATTPKLYLYFTNAVGDIQVDEYTALANDPTKADTSSRRVMLRAVKASANAAYSTNHNGGSLRFGPDGYLYIGIGDGGGGNDAHGPIGNGQRPDTFFGKLLRIDVDTRAGGKPYGIPSGNPKHSVTGLPANFLPEILHWGLRNPFRIEFDSLTGALWIGDVGQDAWEELDFVEQGEVGCNFGWRCREAFVATPHISHGSNCTADGPTIPAGKCSATAFTDPVIAEANPPYCSVFAGKPYHGCKMPGYHDTMFYSDWCISGVSFFSWKNGVAGLKTASVFNPKALAWAEDEHGELYFADGGSRVFRLEPQ